MRIAIFLSLCTLGGLAMDILTGIKTQNVNILPSLFFVTAYVLSTFKWIRLGTLGKG